MKLSRDLSNYDSLVSKMFTWPRSSGQWEQYKLTEDQVGFFHANGYLSGIKLLEEWQVDQLNRELDRSDGPRPSGP